MMDEIDLIKYIAILVRRAANLNLTKGEEAELIEFICVEQNTWAIDSAGWKVLETLKEFVRT